MDFQSLAIKVARSENLPVLPQVVGSIIRLADDPNASAADLERYIEVDAALAGKILRVANTPQYSTSRVPTIGRAMSLLGSNTVRSLAIGIAYHQSLTNRSGSSEFDILEFWRHSLAVACASRILGKLKLPLRSEELYVAGLLHDIGMLVMERFAAEEFDQVIRHAKGYGLRLHEAENQLFAFDHAAVGALLADKWELGPVVRQAMGFHHKPLMDTECPQTTAAVAIANLLAQRSGLHNNVIARDVQIPAEWLQVLELAEEQLGVVQEVVLQEVQRTQEQFNIV